MSSDAWQPSASLATLQLRARILAGIRAFFAIRQVLEVETPCLSTAAVTDPALESFSTVFHGPGERAEQPLYLHTSPEFSMKRLLVAGSGPIYQLARVFRQAERGRRHNPEFTLLEWYRPGFDHHRLMDEVEALVQAVLGTDRALAPAERLTYSELFAEHLQLDALEASQAELALCAERHGLNGILDTDDPRDAWLDLLLTHLIEPQLGRDRPCFVYEYPASQAALARLSPDDPRVAERFELYIDGLELANGFHELGDAVEQRARFEADNERRTAAGMPPMPLDENLLAALEAGMPDCAGVALGVDRLVMLAAGTASIDEVIAFPFERA